MMLKLINFLFHWNINWRVKGKVKIHPILNFKSTRIRYELHRRGIWKMELWKTEIHWWIILKSDWRSGGYIKMAKLKKSFPKKDDFVRSKICCLQNLPKFSSFSWRFWACLKRRHVYVAVAVAVAVRPKLWTFYNICVEVPRSQ